MVIRLDEAFSKGSAKILQNKNLVKSLADSYVTSQPRGVNEQGDQNITKQRTST